MKVLVVFESMFGNTEALAASVARGLRETGADVDDVRVGAAGDHALGGCDLLVLAAPTHALSLSRPASRADAVDRGADTDSASTGVRDWPAERVAADPGMVRPPVVVFDTRARIARHWPGSAARVAAHALRHQGFTVIARTSFDVDDVEGPLLPGELERAREWGFLLATRATRAAAARGS